MSRGLPRGTIKLKPEDFVVDEIPAYEPSGEGSHLYVRFKKTNLTTDEVVKAFARALRVERRDIGVAGLKDKVGVTTQWISVPAADASLDERVASLAIGGVELLERRRHANKLKTGHLRGNRFTLVVRDIDAARVDEVVSALARIGEEGVPNAFGEQRFGRDGDTHERARAWLTGKERAPNDPRLRRFHFSALQSAIFNAVLEHRVADGSWSVPILGDLLKKEETGGIFVCTDVQLDRERARQGEVCPTGPIVGDRMRQPEADAFDLEQRISSPLIEGIDLRRARSLGEGTRRPLRLRVADISHTILDSSLHEAASSTPGGPPHAGCAMTVRFVLPKGAYATTVLSNAFSISDAGRLERSGEQPDEREERQLATLTEEE
ncbi:MAG: tRNA pseudouridine(13) synthase TruD [Labilithrix sp.]|nr:tRNA pseudouridine(13) synthase TruD [Labilithrix sp.]